MEFEDLSEQIDWQAQRVATAFGVREWERKDGIVPRGRYRRLFSFDSLNARPNISWRISQWHSDEPRIGEVIEIADFAIAQDGITSTLSWVPVDPPHMDLATA